MALWFSYSKEQILTDFGSSEEGLTPSRAGELLGTFGPNKLPDEKTRPLALLFLGQFQSPLIYLLIGASVVLYFLGETADGLIIVAILLFNAVVGTVQEGKAQNTLQALKNYIETTATVLRDGAEYVIPDVEVVPGDIIVLHEGDKIPADARLIYTEGLQIEEAALTGESEPIHKTIEPIKASSLSTVEMKNMLFRGTHVVSGHGKAIVVATGIETVIGGIAIQISAIDTESPLKANIRHLSRAIIIVVAIVATTFFGFGVLLGYTYTEMFAVVVSLSVSIIPEGLPIVMTLVLAGGVWRMSKRNVLVKKLPAVEALGQANVIAVDKTGTITKNELVVRKIWVDERLFTVDGDGYEPVGTIELDGASVDPKAYSELRYLSRVAAVSANARLYFNEQDHEWKVTGDPTEAALLVLAQKQGDTQDELLKQWPRTLELPFEYQRKYSAGVHDIEGQAVLSVTGAPEVLLSVCTHVRKAGKDVPLTETARNTIEETFLSMSAEGLRVLALGVRPYTEKTLEHEAVRGLTFVGLFAMRDTLRAEVSLAMTRARSAGMRVVMITGDHAITARAIATEAGIFREGDGVLTGADIDGMLDVELQKKLQGVSVFARVTPEHKMRIISAYKKRGDIIAMTGDGVNDAPSLVAADLGIAMGGIGTEVAKEASDLVLLDDNFGSIISAVEEGRGIYKTIQKVILYLFSTSAGEALVIGGALVLGIPLPLLAAQIIWLNFVTDGFLDVSLAMEPNDKGILRERFVRPGNYLINRLMVLRMVLMSITMMIGTLYLFDYYYMTDVAKAWTISLTVLAVFQWFNAWNCRSETRSIFQINPFSNKYLVGATAIVIILQILAVYTPFLQGILHTTPLTGSDWLVCVAVASSILVVEEVRKLITRISQRKG